MVVVATAIVRRGDGDVIYDGGLASAKAAVVAAVISGGTRCWRCKFGVGRSRAFLDVGMMQELVQICHKRS